MIAVQMEHESLAYFTMLRGTLQSPVSEMKSLHA
jgi:hypothetical protein